MLRFFDFTCIECQSEIKFRLRPGNNNLVTCPTCYESLEFQNDTLIKRLPTVTQPLLLETYFRQNNTHSVEVSLFTTFVMVKYHFNYQLLSKEVTELSSIHSEKRKKAISELVGHVWNRPTQNLTLFNSSNQVNKKLTLLAVSEEYSCDWYNSVLIEYSNNDLESQFKQKKLNIDWQSRSFDTNWSSRLYKPLKYTYIGRPSPNAIVRCSDNACPCPEIILPKYQGYMYIEEIDTPLETIYRGNITCEEGARLRDLDLKSANQDAKIWWERGEIPNRVSKKNFDRDQIPPIRQSYNTESQRKLNEQVQASRLGWVKQIAPNSKRERNILFIDIETNGLPRDRNGAIEDSNNWPYIIQAAWLLYSESGVLRDRGNYIIKPENFYISEESFRIHGISTERAKLEGIPCQQVLNELSSVIETVDIVVAHNLEFDVKIIQAEMLRNQFENKLKSKNQFCTMINGKDYCKLRSSEGLKFPTLQELYFKTFQRNYENSHDALVDVLATAECFWELKNKSIFKLDTVS